MKQALALLAGLAVSLPTIAADPLPAAGRNGALDFALRFAEYDTTFDYAGTAVDTTVQLIGLSVREHLGAGLYLGAHGGYTFVSQTNNPLTVGKDLDGYHAGLSLSGVLHEWRALRLHASAEYLYQRVEQETAGQNVELRWHEPRATLGATWTLSPLWRLNGGVGYGSISGQEQDAGAVNRTRDFKRHARAGAFFGVDVTVDRDGYVGIAARSGLDRGAAIYFKRDY